MSANAVEVRDLSKQYGLVSAIQGVSFDVPVGKCLTLLGASGSGKTTTLRLIAGFEEVDVGQITISGCVVNNVPAHKRNLAMVFQNFALFPHMTVEQNIAYPLETRGHSKRERRELVGKILELVRLPGIQARYPKQLSGGQQQRVALARALVYEPQVLLMDEALSGLDKKLRDALQMEIRALQKQMGITMIIVTHDQTEALVMSDAVALMHEGRIEQIGAPLDLYHRPASHYVASFIGECNLIVGSARRDAGCGIIFESKRGLRVPVAGQNESPSICHLAIRPECITVRSFCEKDEKGEAVGTVAEAIHLGDAVRYRIELVDGEFFTAKALASRAPTYAPGTSVSLNWSSDDVSLIAGS